MNKILDNIFNVVFLISLLVGIDALIFGIFSGVNWFLNNRLNEQVFCQGLTYVNIVVIFIALVYWVVETKIEMMDNEKRKPPIRQYKRCTGDKVFIRSRGLYGTVLPFPTDVRNKLCNVGLVHMSCLSFSNEEVPYVYWIKTNLPTFGRLARADGCICDSSDLVLTDR